MVRKAITAAVLMMLCISAPAMGQINDPSVKPENIEPLPTQRPIFEYILAAASLAAVLAIGFKPSKRNAEAS